MKRITITTLGVIGMLSFAPILGLAEETTVSADGSAGAAVVAPADTPKTDDYSWGASNPSTAGTGGGMGAGREVPPPKPQNAFEYDVKAPRDVATGQSSGKRMATPNASGTRPIPPAMENRMMERERMGSGTPEERKEQMEEKREEMKERMEERRGEIMKRMSERMIDRMTAAIERLTKLTDRIDSRIAKLSEKGVDTTTAKANVAIARTKLADAGAAVVAAQGAVAGAVSAADAATGSTTPSGAGKAVRDSLEKARLAVVDAHKAIVEAVKSLKANAKVEGHAEGGATSTTVAP